MRGVFFPGLALMAMVLFAGCGKDTVATEGGLTGMWNATKVEYVSRTGTDAVELVSQGCVATLDLREDHAFVYTCTPPEGDPTLINATWELTGDVGDVMRVDLGDRGEMNFDVELSGSTLKLTNGGSEFDFNNDDLMEDADMNLALTRGTP